MKHILLNSGKYKVLDIHSSGVSYPAETNVLSSAISHKLPVHCQPILSENYVIFLFFNFIFIFNYLHRVKLLFLYK